MAAVGVGLAYPGVTVGAVADIDTSRHGLASGLQQTSFQIGSGVGLTLYVTVATALTTEGGAENGTAALVNGFTTAMVANAAVVGIAVLTALTLRSGIEAESTVETAHDGREPTPES